MIAIYRTAATHIFKCNVVRLRLQNLAIQAATNKANVVVDNQSFTCDQLTNVTPTIISKVGCNLYHQAYHPLRMIKAHIEDYIHAMYRRRSGSPLFVCIDNLSPVVTTEQNFDSLLIPGDHITRTKNDNYYINSSHMLRAHTSAHQRDLIRSGLDAFLFTGDCYRRDEIDAKHYPVFHQMEGVRLFNKLEVFSNDNQKDIFDKSMNATVEKQSVYDLEASKFVENDMKDTLTGIMNALFGAVEMRFVDAYFPFTHPSWELEIRFQDEWMEILGCGIMKHEILVNGGWAFGIGLERLAMTLFDIPDIRLFWSKDERFISQFKTDSTINHIKFQPFSLHPALYQDISFWLCSEYSQNNFYDIARSIGGDLIEQIKLIDTYSDKKSGRESHCYRLTYRSMERTLTNEEVNAIQKKIHEAAETKLGIEVRRNR